MENNLIECYMVSPATLNERQLLIYRALYSNCNPEDMLVAVTVDDIRKSIKVAKLSNDTIYNNLKIMIDEGHIEKVRNKFRGNPPVYRLVYE